MIKKLLKIFSNSLSIDYVTKYLRNKGIATHKSGDNSLTFKLYDMNWDLYYEEGRLGLKNSFNLGNDINMNCMLQAINKLNADRWIVKSFIDIDNPENDSSTKEDRLMSIVFSFESFCYSDSDFEKTYEFAIYAMTDGIEFHRKCYAENLKELNTRNPNPIGFHKEQNKNKEESSSVDNQKRPRIGFHS